MSTAETVAAPAEETSTSGASATRPEMFTFGEPEPVVGGRSMILDYIECYHNERWYEPPVDLGDLARCLRIGAHHESALRFKVNVLTSTLRPTRYLDAKNFKAFALDYLVLGNGYFERIDSRGKTLLYLKHSLGKYTRRGRDLDQYFFVQDYGRVHEFPKGKVFHMLEPDIHQEIYGLPQYLGAMQSAFLNEAATLFRRRYYANGSHAGFILYITDPAQDQGDVDKMREQLTKAKGVGNFKNLFYYAPNGQPDGIKLIPISEVAAKDEFLHIKNSSRDDVLAAHRVPPQLMGMMPNNTSGFGDVGKAAIVFARNEIAPLQMDLKNAINSWAGVEACDFEPYTLGDGALEDEKDKTGKKV